MEYRVSISKQTTLNANAFYYGDGRWLPVLKRPMKTNVNGKFIPTSFHTSDRFLVNSSFYPHLGTFPMQVLEFVLRALV